MTKKALALATSIMILVGFVAGVDAYVYPRREGENLEKRIDRIDKRTENSEKRIGKNISYIIKKLDSMYLILLKNK